MLSCFDTALIHYNSHRYLHSDSLIPFGRKLSSTIMGDPKTRNGGTAEWRNGGMAEWRNGGMAEFTPKH